MSTATATSSAPALAWTRIRNDSDLEGRARHSARAVLARECHAAADFEVRRAEAGHVDAGHTGWRYGRICLVEGFGDVADVDLRRRIEGTEHAVVALCRSTLVLQSQPKVERELWSRAELVLKVPSIIG